MGHTISGNHGKLWLAESPACSLCFAVLPNILVYEQFSAIAIMVPTQCSFRNAGARDHPGCVRGEAHRAAQENVQHCWRGHLHLGLHHQAAQLLPLGDVPAWHGPRAHQTGGQADVLHHWGCNTQQPPPAQGHVLLEQRDADKVGQLISSLECTDGKLIELLTLLNIILMELQISGISVVPHTKRCRWCWTDLVKFG